MTVLTNHSTGRIRASLAFSLTTLLAFSLVVADEIYEAQLEPATTAQAEFIDRIIAQVDASVPPIDGWTRELRAMVSGDTVRDGERPLIDVQLQESPLIIALKVEFKSITAEDEREANVQKSSEQLQEELMAAAMSGDTQKMDALQQELAALMQSHMESSGLGQAAGMSPVRPMEKRRLFYVNVTVNGEGENIGKKYDIDQLGVTKAFRIDSDNPEQLRFRYYLGGWEVSELDERNWRIASPAEHQNSANHLHALTARVTVYGDRRTVEDYVTRTLDLKTLNQMVD